MTDKTLRQLAHAHAKGELNKEQYRKARADLLEGILTGEISLRENDYPSPVKPRTQEDTFDEVTERKLKSEKKSPDSAVSEYKPAPASGEPQRRPATSQARQSKKWPVIAGLSGLVLVPVLVYLILPSSPAPDAAGPAEGGTEPPVAENTGNSVTETAPVAASSGSRKLIKGFLENRSWTRDSIDNFVSSWQSLPADQRQTARNSVVFGQLTNAIYKQLLAEKAMTGLDESGTAVEKQRMLVEFANKLGIEDPRITMPEDSGKPAASPQESGAGTAAPDQG